MNVGTREEAEAARAALLEREKELTRRSDELARERQELPWVQVERDYRFETDEGTRTLAELFDGRSQLLVYHFMFGPDYGAGCPTCSSGADTYDGAVAHLNARDVTFVCSSRAPLERLQAFKRRMGWAFPWVSSFGTDFNYDFGVSHKDVAPVLDGVLASRYGALISKNAAAAGTDPAAYLTEAPGLNAFALEDGVVYHTYSTAGRGLEVMMGYYPLLDRVPRGRDEGETPQLWIRFHDEYE